MFSQEERKFAGDCKREMDRLITKAKAFAAGKSAKLRDPDSPYLSAEEAAAYLDISLSTFYKVARKIQRCPQNKKYLREDLDTFAKANKPRFTRPAPKRK